MKYYIITVFIMFCFFANAQENYSSLTEIARNKTWNAKETADNEVALKMFEDAFSIFPDSIIGPDVYEASVVASKLQKKDKAFNYLNLLLDIKKEADGYPTWDYILGNYSKEDYQNLFDDSRWKIVAAKAELDKKDFIDDLIVKENEFYNQASIDFSKIKKPKKLYKTLKSYNVYQHKQNQNYSIRFKINDSISTSFFVHLPSSYNPNNKYPLLFFLHGAVRGSQLMDFQLASWNLESWNRYYTKYADLNNVILVFPQANKTYNWMLSDDGFFMVPDILKKIKQAINIDDEKVFISGHSNGATGSFSYLMKQPTPFSGFYGFNTQPKVYTGGTFVENIKNRSFINFSTDGDYYYPPNANDDFSKLMNQINADYKDYRYNGFPHWFPEFDESESAYEILFNDLKKRKRNSFPNEIIWEFDDDKNGNIDWISDIKIDTISSKAKWHNQLNFKIDKWLVYDKNDSLISKEVDKLAFDFPRKSGKIIANYKDNVFQFKTSNIKCFVINISPEMVDLNKKIEVYVNGKLYYNKKTDYNREFMLSNFIEKRDCAQIWINQIPIQLE